MTVTQQEAGCLFNWRVWPPSSFLLVLCLSFIRASGIQGAQAPVFVQRHQNCDIWLPSEVFAWLAMKKRRLEFQSEGSCQKHSQHHTCSFFNHDQVLPIMGNLNSKVCLVSNGTSDASFISLTSDRVTNGSYWSLTPPKPQTQTPSMPMDSLSLFFFFYTFWCSLDFTCNRFRRTSSGPGWCTICPPSPLPFSTHSQPREAAFPQSCMLSGCVPATKRANWINKTHTGPLGG